MDCTSDRIFGLQVIKNQEVILSVIGVYMPYHNSTRDQTDLFIDTTDQIQCILDKYGSNASFMVT